MLNQVLTSLNSGAVMNGRALAQIAENKWFYKQNWTLDFCSVL
jgi:hypothetical protein